MRYSSAQVCFILLSFVLLVSAQAFPSRQAQSVPEANGAPKNSIAIPREPEGGGQGAGGQQRMMGGQPQSSSRDRLTIQKGVLDRFKEFQGAKNPAALMALFAASFGPVSQDPPVVLSDGITPVKISVTGGNGQAPAFAIKGAKLLSMRPAEKNSWVLELLPDKGTYQASITILSAEGMTEYPLTVAPEVDIDLDKSGKITEDDFKVFLDSEGKGATSPGGEGKEPQPMAKVPFDLNNDGKRDYIDDFIFTANYLVAQKKKEQQPAGK